ncbi:hypothetical protein SprV_0902702100 [Sparganum proliferum]
MTVDQKIERHEEAPNENDAGDFSDDEDPRKEMPVAHVQGQVAAIECGYGPAEGVGSIEAGQLVTRSTRLKMLVVFG